MPYTNPLNNQKGKLHLVRFIRLGLISLLIAITYGCEVGGIKSDGEKQDENKGPDGEVIEEVFVPLPNPYEASKKSAPIEAVKEFARAKVAMENEKWDQAEELLTLMTVTFPELSGPYVNLGVVLAKKGEFEEAENSFKFAIEKNPHNFDAYSQLGVLYREQGKFTEAESTYLSALKLWPHHAASVKNLGILYDLYMGRFDEALQYYELAQKLSGGEDRQLKGWIIDLKRRMQSE